MLYSSAGNDSVTSLATYIGNIDYLYLNIKNVAVESIKALSEAITKRQLQVRSCHIFIV